MRPVPGDAAPELGLPDLEGRPVRLEAFRGRHLLLSFYRYAACPFCNLRIREVGRASGDLRALGVEPVAVFHSSAKAVRKHMRTEPPPFPILPDPTMALYRRYGVERSWAGLLRGMLRVGEIARAASKGYLPIPRDLRIHTMPADFLIGPEGRVLAAYHGRDMGDHIGLDTVGALVEGGRARRSAG